MDIKKSELKASKDSQGYYEVRHFGRIIWDGCADSASEAKNLAIEFKEKNKRTDWE